MVKPTHTASGPKRPQVFPFAVALSVWATYLQAGLPFHTAAREDSQYFDSVLYWPGGAAFFPQFLLAVLVGSAWLWLGRAWWVARPGRALGFYLGVSLAITILFLSLGLGGAGHTTPWPITGLIAGLALGAVLGWIAAGIFAPWTRASHALTAPWGITVFAVVFLALLPLDIKALLAQPAFAQWDLPERVYQLLKPAILWAAVGLIGGLGGHGHQARLWGMAGVFGFLVCAPLASDVFLYGDVVEVMALLPGLAMGLWLGERSRFPEILGQGQAAGKLSILATNGDALHPVRFNAHEAIEHGVIASSKAHISGHTMPAQIRGAHPDSQANYPAQGESETSLQSLSSATDWASRVLGLALLGLVAVSLLDFPLWGIVLAVGLISYMAALWRLPMIWLVIVPAALPLLDFAPWTGRFFWDEFDLLMLVTLAVALWQGRFRLSAWAVPRLGGLLGLFVLAWFVSLLVGLLPFQPLGANAFSAYWSHYNSLRLGKSLLWGLVFYGLYRSQPVDAGAFIRLSIGMALGVVGVSLWALWEQALFAGAATTADYRVTAGFSSMHTGGGHFEAYLVIALPFVWGLCFLLRNPLYRALAGASFLLGSYALFFTVARGGLVALGVALMILVLGTWLARRKQSIHRAGLGAPLAMGVLTLVVMAAGVSSVFWKQRLEQTGADAGIRFSHWADVLSLRDSGVATALFGQGLGSLPAANLASQLPDKAGSYRYAAEGGNTYLALNSAGTLYMAQRVAPHPAETLRLEISVRAPLTAAGLEASLCEKILFNSRQCQWLKVEVKTGGQEWQRHTQAFSSGEVGAGNLLTRRPVQFSLYNPAPGTVVEVDNIRLLDERGQNLLRNGDFSQGGDFWFFKSGDHLFWHAKNLWVHLLFEQGWLGVMLFSLLMILALVRLMRAVGHGGLEATVMLAALGAWTIVGMVDSLVDAPRIALLVYGQLFIGAAWGASPRAPVKSRQRSRHRRRHGSVSVAGPLEPGSL